MEITVIDPLDGTKYKLVHWIGGLFAANVTFHGHHGGGAFKGNVNALDGFKLYYDNGNIASGEFYLYGLVKS